MGARGTGIMLQSRWSLVEPHARDVAASGQVLARASRRRPPTASCAARIRGGGAPSSAPARPHSRARLDQTNERADDTIEVSREIGRERLEPAERFGGFETSQRFARGRRRGLIASLPILAATVRPFRDVERDADQRPLELIAERLLRARSTGKSGPSRRTSRRTTG